MTRFQLALAAFLLVFLGSFPSSLSAQRAEVYVFGGGFLPGNKVFGNDLLPGANMPGGGTYGVKVGVFVHHKLEVDGDLSRYNHFALARPEGVFAPMLSGMIFLEPKVRSLLWEGSGTWHFTDKTIGTRFTPYITLGLGGMTARIKDADSVSVTGGGFIRNPVSGSMPEFIINPARRIVMDDNDTFFTFSYGGGLKAMRVWGPAGFRVDVRGRTIPNFYSQSLTRPELTAGIILNWGER